MVQWGTVFVAVTATSFLLGRKELPKIGRVLGLYSGRSVGAILRAKKEFFDATNDNNLVKLQREFQRGIEELNEIRSELTSVGSTSVSTNPSGVRSSVSLASTAEYTMQDGVRRSAEASLAMAELKLAEQGKFAPRIESQEGGADYVSASIMDSLLLDKQKPKTSQE
ncbi:hypothetical protein BBO99_00007921 [Phytophthora kernoviae]|uniref:Uncharacterized protein n=2 Tax=Phytophthora kernoviae TaxID=325452 RepID=A0A3R7MKL3_9STRA|nr:hypothetical protein G195_009365 [Phytophthora kernoviae 00238/432]KAG2514227.1 hypothetical protein JM16_007846 [Phytophthora kernoviae]KAG2518192.1 hypothetical protein JM18_007779 [Phytophthora kernoviae]RLN02440.1 hypothetical protein BBI17_007872 [Phytophthora kernoviae]RLN75971.1 hypothetical protein BBO99_00007921 [Phytophthora kernoviae]